MKGIVRVDTFGNKGLSSGRQNFPHFRPFSSIFKDRSVGQPLEVHIRKLQEFYWSESDPDGRGFVPLADALRKAGEFQEASRILRDGLRRHPDFLAGHVVSAWLSLDQGHPGEAERHFQAAMDLDPKNVAALRGLAELHLEKGDEDSALDYMEALLAEDPVDLELPSRLEELRDQIQTRQEAQRHGGSEGEALPWGDPSGVEAELDWGDAILQPDSGPSPSAISEEENPDESVRPLLVVEDGEPIPAEGDLEDSLITSTLGEIYLRQGLLGRAEWVFESLLEEDPENEHLRRRLDEVQELLRSQDSVEEMPPETSPVDEQEEAGTLESSVEGSGGSVTEWRPEGFPEAGEVEVVPIESLAPDRASPGRPAPTSAADIPEDVVPVELLGPGEIVPVESLGPEEAVPIESLEPAEIVPIAFLAPEEPISVELLAPDGPIPIQDLAPSEPVPIESLAPSGPVSIVSLAPDGDEGVSIEGSDSTIQDFERWLDKLQ